MKKMKNNLCSIIVPIYNVEPFISKCIKSILNQDYKELEIILVDDGSTDGSSKVVDEYALLDSRIISVHKENEGVSEARNTGVRMAKGEYIMFVDGDDYVEPNYVSSFVYLMEKTQADMGVSYSRLVDDEKKKNLELTFEIKNGISVLDEMYLEKIDVAVWNKIYRKSLLDQYNIRFNTLFWFAEGMTFNVECYLHFNKIATTNFEVYHQVTNANSAVRKFNIESWRCGQRALLFQKKLLEESEDVPKRVLNSLLFHYFGYDYVIMKGIIQFKDKCKYGFLYKEAKNNLRKNISFPLKADISLKKKFKCILQAIFPDLLIYYELYKCRF